MKPAYRIVLGLFLLSGCANHASLTATQLTPAATAKVEVDEGPNGNTVAELEVNHLAPPSNLRGDLQVYVAWIRPAGEVGWTNVGQLMVEDDREGKLKMVIPHKEFDVLVSGEPEGNASIPSRYVVLQGQVRR